MHLAARFCAKEAVAKALELRVWNPRDVEVVGGGDVPPSVRLTGHAAARAEELGVAVRVSLTHTRATAGAVAVLRMSCAPWLTPLPDAAAHARDGRLGDRGARASPRSS